MPSCRKYRGSRKETYMSLWLESNPAKSDGGATRTTLKEQTGKVWKEGKPRIKMTKRQTGFLKEEEVHVMMNKKKRLMKEGEVNIVILIMNQARKLPIKEKDHTMKMSQGKRLPRGY